LRQTHGPYHKGTRITQSYRHVLCISRCPLVIWSLCIFENFPPLSVFNGTRTLSKSAFALVCCRVKRFHVPVSVTVIFQWGIDTPFRETIGVAGFYIFWGKPHWLTVLLRLKTIIMFKSVNARNIQKGLNIIEAMVQSRRLGWYQTHEVIHSHISHSALFYVPTETESSSR